MINLNGSSYKLYYLDTCVLSELVKDKTYFGSYLLNLVLNDGIIAVSSYSLWELKSAPVVYRDVLEVITTLPSVLLKDEETLVKDEYRLLKGEINEIDPIAIPLLSGSLKQYGIDILDILDKNINERKINIFKKNIEEIFKILDTKPSNIYAREELVKSKRNVEFSVSLAAYQMVSAYLMPELEYYVSLQKEFPISNIQSLLSSSYILNYKYFQANRKATNSDIPDILMSIFYPYVDVVVTERNQCSIIKQIQKRHNFLTNVKAISINQVRKEEY